MALTRRIFSALNKKNLWNSVHYKQSYKRSCWPALSRQCAFGVCQCIWVRATWLWWRKNFTPPLISFQSDLGRRADSRWALPQISSWSWTDVCQAVADLDVVYPSILVLNLHLKYCQLLLMLNDSTSVTKFCSRLQTVIVDLLLGRRFQFYSLRLGV